MTRSVRIVLDAGSQKTYITDRVRGELALTAAKEQCMAQSLETQSLDKTMRSFWERECFGITAAGRSLYDELRNTIVFREGRYEVSLLWKTPRQDLPNNYKLSLRRLRGLLRHLSRDPDILREHDTVATRDCGARERPGWS